MTEVTKLKLLVTDHNNSKTISERNPTMEEKKLSGLFSWYSQEMQHWGLSADNRSKILLA